MENNNINRPQPHCPIIDINGKIANGNQFDLDIRLPEDNRTVIYGVITDSCKRPVKDAVVKLIEVERKDCKEKREPVSHTFTDKHGEFVFGPLCPDKEYAIDIWVDNVRHFKVCADCHFEGKCLKGEPMDKCDFKDKCENKYEEKYDDKYENKYDEKCEKHDMCKCEPINKCKPMCKFNPMDKCDCMMNKR